MTMPETPLVLADGRELDFAVTGPASGTPLVLHNSTPGSVVQYPAIQKAAHERGLRLMTFSRPGYGRSTRLPGRVVVDVVADVEALLDHLGFAQCLTVGWSGGGPHALATAARLPARVAGAVSVSGFAPRHAPGLDFVAGMTQGNLDGFARAAAGESAVRASLDDQASSMLEAGAAGVQEGLANMLTPLDRSFLTAEVAAELWAVTAEALRHGADGWIDDDLAFARPWGFDVGEISVPTCVWQGGEDLMVPFAHGEWLAEHIPGAAAYLDRGQGHMSLGLGQFGPIIDELLKTVNQSH
jgi:pimeloyl-ACP methyl ester carboxylesterase